MALLMRDIFEKPIDRPIDGVIKADDDASLRTELEEYVITGEIGKRLGEFLDAYNNYSTANGVWISGFFGSGKSHLLKMLALILENRQVEGGVAADILLAKLTDEPMLAGALRKAVAIPSKSILFNIDQKADVISKTDIDALLAVFQKVFDEMCGYFGKQPHIAQFERHLDERGQFAAFKSAFLEVSGKAWETRGRQEALLEGRNIALAFANATGSDPDDAKDILGQYRKDTRVSIEDFANTVKAWIDRQAPNFRLNFFVDEVGQYIADNVKLMTNLQTIAESLNTKCRGQAWIIVTAQQAITEVLGDRTAQQENDFSKIQARFANRMPLNSADVAEVIQRRLLAKTEAAAIVLGKLTSANFTNILITADHGFLYQHRALDESDFAIADPKGEEILFRNRRFVIGRGLARTQGMKHFTAQALGLAGDLEVLIPNSINRMRVKGSGSRFVHGGAALQEIVVPVIKVTKRREADVGQVEVKIIVPGRSLISSGQTAVTLYQVEPASEKMRPRELLAGIYAADGTLISDEVALTFDFRSENPREREMPRKFLLSREADRFNNQDVALKLRERVGKTSHYQDYASHRFELRRGMSTDFDF